MAASLTSSPSSVLSQFTDVCPSPLSSDVRVDVVVVRCTPPTGWLLSDLERCVCVLVCVLRVFESKKRPPPSPGGGGYHFVSLSSATRVDVCV